MKSLVLLAAILSSLLLMTVVRFGAEWRMYWSTGLNLTSPWKPCTCQTGFCNNFQPNMTYDLFELVSELLMIKAFQHPTLLVLCDVEHI